MSAKTSLNPAGSLLAEATRKAEKKPSHVHTSEAQCGCRVTVDWISKGCQLINFDRCAEHVFTRGSR